MSGAQAMGVPAPGFWERLRGLQARLVAQPRFRRWAIRFPFTRPVARRNARRLFDLCAGFVYSQVLLACVRLDLFALLHAEGATDLGALARRLDLPEDAAHRLLTAAVSLGLLTRQADGRFALDALGAAMVGDQGLAGLVEHHAALYADLRDPVALLRGERSGAGGLQGIWPYSRAEDPAALGDADVAHYSALMAHSQTMIAEDVLDAVPLSRHRCLMDVGGGEGVFLATAGLRAPHLQLMLFDLPAVAARAQQRLAAKGLGDRARAVGGNVFRDELPKGADLISLVRVLHDHDDDAALSILRAVRRALPPDGTLLLAEPMAGTAGAEAMGGAYFGFYLLAMGQGRPRSAAETAGLLQRAGFLPPRLLRTRMPLLARALTARPDPELRQGVSFD
jgi:demethylspheroidene O-methyltransferase